jgi:hypothetical protein
MDSWVTIASEEPVTVMGRVIIKHSVRQISCEKKSLNGEKGYDTHSLSIHVMILLL